MKKLPILLAVAIALGACKENKSTAENATTNTTQTEIAAKEQPAAVKTDYKIKSVTRVDFLADYQYGNYVKGDQIARSTRRFNEQLLPYEIELEVKDPDKVKIAGDTLSKTAANIFSYQPEKKGDTVEMYNEKGELVEVLVKKPNTMYGYTVDNKEEPFVIRNYDDQGNYLSQVINADGFLFVTEYDIVDRDENGFATTTHARWIQYKKRDDINYEKIDFSRLEVVDKNYQIVEFNYELYQ